MLTLRPAAPEDVSQILKFIRELAAYEREPDAVLATEADLLRDGFTEPRRFYCLLAEWNETPAGFALYFYSYSTWEGRAGIYLEGLFVRPNFAGRELAVHCSPGLLPLQLPKVFRASSGVSLTGTSHPSTSTTRWAQS